MPLELYTGARLTKYVEQMLCLPHPKMQLRNQTQRLPSKDWSTIKLRHLLTTQAESPLQTPAQCLGAEAPCPACSGPRLGLAAQVAQEHPVPILQQVSTRVSLTMFRVQRR